MTDSSSMGSTSGNNITWLCVCAAVFVIQSGLGARIPRPNVVLEISSPESVTQHEPVIIEIAIVNNSTDVVSVELGLDRKAKVTLRLRTPNGAVLGMKPAARTSGMSFEPLGPEHVPAGGRWASKLILNDLFTIDGVGSYELEIQFDGDVRSSAGQKMPLDRIHAASFRVLPRNQEVLRQKCENWLQIGRSAPSTSEQAEALTALQHVIDVVAIPYLRDAVEVRHWWEALATIERIGGPEAKAALDSLHQSRDPLVARMAKSVIIKRPKL